MEPIFEKLISTGGPSGVLVVCVWLFLKHMAEQADLNRQLFKEIHQEHIASRSETRETIADNSRAIREFAVAVRNCPMKPTA